MGDPLSIAASVAGLITISAQIVGMAKELFDKVKDAPETMMRVREEVESMHPIFCQVQLFLIGSGSRLNYGNLTMISIHNLMATLTGCVIVYSRLEKKVNEVCGFGDPTTASATWRRAGIIADRVKWGLWRHEEVLGIIEDLQRQKLSLNLMLNIITCTTTTEASKIQGRLLELCTEIMQSSHAHSVLLRDLISRQDVQAQTLEEIQSYTSTLSATGSSAVSSRPSDNRDNFDNASIMSKRSTFSLRLGLPAYMEDLKASRAYKRLRYFGLGIDSSAESVFSLESDCSAGKWSMLSDITLGDLSVSQIAVLNLPIGLADVSNPEPFQMEIPHSPSQPRGKWSSRGRLHNAIGTSNVFVVRALLAMGMDVEELDSNGRTPLVHAAVKCEEAICKLLLEKGASVEAFKAFTSGMDVDERSKLLHPVITGAIANGSRSVAALRLLVFMALGTNDGGGDNNLSFSRSMIHTAIDMNYEVVVLAIIHLDPLALVTTDSNGRTPLVHAAVKYQEAICKLLLEKGASVEAFKAFTSGMDVDERSKLLHPVITGAIANGSRSVTALRSLVFMALGTNDGGGGDNNLPFSQSMIHAAIDMDYEVVALAIIHLDPLALVGVDSNGRTPLVHAAMKCQEATCKLLLEKGASVEALKAFTSGMDVHERSKLLDPVITGAIANGSRSVTVLRLLVLIALGTNDGGDDNLSFSQSMVNAAIDMNYGLVIRAIIQLEPLALVRVGINGRTPFAYAYHLQRDEICEMLLQNSKLDIEAAATEVIILKGDFIRRVHVAIEEKYVQLLSLLLLAAGTNIEKIGIEVLAHDVGVVLNSKDTTSDNIYKAFPDNEIVKRIKSKPGDYRWIATSMQELVEKNYKSVLVFLSLIGSCDAEGWTPLASAAFNNNEALCKFLVENGCSLCLSAEQKKQLKPKLSNCVHRGLRSGHETVLQLLLDMGVDVNDRVDWGGSTALLEAVRYGKLSCVKILIERGADTTISSNDKRTVLHHAASNGYKQIMKFLLEDVETRKLVNVVDGSGSTALYICAMCSPDLEIAKMLVQAGAIVAVKNHYGQTPYGHVRGLKANEIANYLWSRLSPEQRAQEIPPWRGE